MGVFLTHVHLAVATHFDKSRAPRWSNAASGQAGGQRRAVEKGPNVVTVI